MERKYTVTSGLTSLAASTTKIVVQLATGSTLTTTVIGFDISFDSTASGAGAVPIRVAMVRTTGVSSVTGAAATPSKWYSADPAAVTTARINDTTDGASAAILMEWLVSPTAGFSYQFPLGRELTMNASDWVELRVASQSGMTTCNYIGNLHFSE